MSTHEVTGTVADRYVLHRELKSGNGVRTYLARDVRDDVDVVVKAINPDAIHAAARLRFEHESQVLQHLQAAGLTRLHDVGETDGLLYLVQPFLPGKSLEQVLESGPLPLADSLRITLAITSALDAAHAAGICHRDVKPANVIVGPAGDDAVTLIDFGFARSPWLDESIQDDLVGTVRYLAPEAAGLLPVPADERSDLYAVGVLLFECLTGKPPFTAATVGEVLRQHLSMPMPDLAASGAQVPRVVAALLERLLRKEPAERYQSAAALAFDLAAILALLDAGDPEPRLVIGRLDHRRTLTDPAFVGREAELGTLTALVQSLADGSSGLVLLESDSGGGKSRLLAELGRQAARHDVLVLRGQGVQQAAQRPFTLLHGVANDLVAALDEDAVARARLVDGLGDLAPAVALALPALAPTLGIEDIGDSGPEQFGEQRSLQGLRQLLHACAAPDRPVLIVLDDCQWADGLAVRLLSEVFGEGSELPAHLGVVAAFRSEEVAAGHPLRQIHHGQSVRLGPLSPLSMTQLVESMAGPLPAAATTTVVRLADGSPFMGAAVLRGLVESGALVGSPDGWSVDATAMAGVQTARRSAAFLVRRLELLSADALEVLSVGAVLGKEFDIERAVGLAEGPVAAASILEEARSRRLLWVHERTGRCSFFHDKIREALLDRLDEDTRRALHSRAGDALLADAQVGEAAVFELAYHLDAAGRAAEALPWALRAAALARGQHGLDSAVAHYRMASRHVPTDDLETRSTIAEGLGDVLMLQGVYREAQVQLETARALVEEPVRAAALEGKLGDLAFKQGDVVTARRHLEGAMAGVGRPVPRSTFVLVIRLLWELLVQAVHTAVPRLATGRRSPEGAEKDFLAMRLYSRLAYLYWFHSGKVPCAWVHLRGLNLAERYPASAELGQAYSEHAPVMTMLPWFGRSLKYAERSLAIRRELGDVWGQGQSLGFAGVTLYAASRFDEGVTACEEAIRLLEPTGDRWEAGTAGWTLAMCLHRKGELSAAASVARQVHLDARAIGDQTSAGVALSVWARSAPEQVRPELIAEQLELSGEDVSTHCELQLAGGLRALHDQDVELALRHFQAAVDVVRENGLRQEYVATAYPWLATALRIQAEQTSAYDPALQRRRRRSASRAARRARWIAAGYRNNAPHALREAALVAAVRGRPRRARRLLARSEAIADRQGARYEVALTRVALAQLPGGTGEREARATLRSFETATGQQVVEAATASLFDRFTALLAAGRSITAATSLATLEVAIREASLTLLRGERCHLVSVSALTDDRLTSQSGEAVDEVSRTLLRKAVEAGMPVTASDPSAEESESLLLSGIRSVLAAPVMVHGEAMSCFYVTHKQIGHLFGDDEVQLAGFIAALAGAAHEHLAGSEARFRSLVQGSSDVITLVDARGLITYQSSAAQRVFGAPRLLGHPIADWVHPEDVAAVLDALADVGAHGVRVECRLRHGDHTWRYTETQVTDLREDPTVGSLVLNTRDVTDRRGLEDQLRERALHDALTGLPNRTLFLDRAGRALRVRRNRPLVVAFLDLDDFKAVNDTLGHAVGDELLCAIAGRLVGCLRPTETIARLGGDEFGLLLEDTDLEQGLVVVERIRTATAAPMLLGGREVVMHTSIGLAVCDDLEMTPDELLAQADAAMYAAKALGSHRYAVFAPEMRVASETRSRLRGELDHALSEDEFALHYQPIVDLSTGATLGVEALIRWDHPQRGQLSPIDFIDYAEGSGQITAIGEWVINTACEAAPDLPDGSHISVNVSARQLQNPDLVHSVGAALTSSGLPPHRLVLEITETAAVADLESAIRRLEALKGLGVQLALDDFGTGYSALSHLRRFPVDYLKIDRSFVTGIGASAEDAAIVRGVIDMAHALGLRAIAEGVETDAQLAVLRALGCDLGQGYLWQRPAPLTALRSILPAPRPALA